MIKPAQHDDHPAGSYPNENISSRKIVDDPPWLSADDLFLFNEGNHYRLYQKLGAHSTIYRGKRGTHFAVWAPDAQSASVDIYSPRQGTYPLTPLKSSGIWHTFVPEVEPGTIYKYKLVGRANQLREKADPFAFHTETPPRTASIVWDLGYEWNDIAWMIDRHRRHSKDSPISVYEVHLGSWRRHSDGRWLSYREIASQLADYLDETGFTHVELMPITEHPFYGSWGYQTTGYFAPTSRYGTPQDFMFFVDYLHQRGYGVFLDWVPSHFPGDEHGLVNFDGTHLFEHADPRQGFQPDWNTYVFNLGRHEVRSFLISSAVFWLDKYHLDGLRVDAVASMLYLDYSRKPGQWIPNQFGGRENLEAIDFLRRLNQEVYRSFPDVHTIAEESTAWPLVSRPAHIGGLGFDMKWDMGWMHDTLQYFHHDPIFRKYHHGALTFRNVYAFNENFMLSLSHDEVVYGKGSLWNKMPGDEWQKFANLRLLLGLLTAEPGKKLLFMGGEFGQRSEWNHEAALEWDLLNNAAHAGAKRWLHDLNMLYRREPALYERDFDADGFQWINCCDSEQSVIAFLRKPHTEDAPSVLVACNFTPVPRWHYRVGAPRGGFWRELLNSDGHEYAGSGIGNDGGRFAEQVKSFGFEWSLNLTLPPLAIVFLKEQGEQA